MAQVILIAGIEDTRMPQSQSWNWIPTHLTIKQFEKFVLPHLHIGSRGPQPKLFLHAIFNYILNLLYLGCQWKELPITTDKDGQPEIHYSRIYRAFRRFENHGCFENIFVGSVTVLHERECLDITVIHGDGTTTAAKKGGDNLGFSGHKHLKGDKVVAFCDRNCNVIAPFVTAPGNRNESPILKKALPSVTRIARVVGFNLKNTIVSLDGVYDSRNNRKAIFNRGMIPNINENLRGRKTPKRGRKRFFIAAIFKERFRTIERVFVELKIMGLDAYIYFAFENDVSDKDMNELFSALCIPEDFSLVKLSPEDHMERAGFQYEVVNPCRYYSENSKDKGWWERIKPVLEPLVTSDKIEKVWYGSELDLDEITESVARGYRSEPHLELFTKSRFDTIQMNHN